MATLSSVLPPVSVSTASGILPVGNGGTGATELALDNVLLGNGSSAPKVVAPGTAGNVLTSNGTTWASSPAAGGISSVNYPQNSQSANYTLVLGDAGKQIFHPVSDTAFRTFTIPANSSVAFPIGTVILFTVENGALPVNVAITSDTLVFGNGTTGTVLVPANQTLMAIKVTATKWMANYLYQTGLPSSQSVAVSHQTTPFVTAYPWTGSGYGSKFANPATLPTNDAYSVAFHPSGNAIAIGHLTTPFVTAYPWSSSGFGVKFANPATLPGSVGAGVAFSPAGNAIAVADNTTPFILAYPWSSSGFGTKFANPSTLPTGLGNGVAFNPEGTAVAVAHNTTPFISVYPWSVSGFGTKFTNPATLPGSLCVGVTFNPAGTAIAVAQSSSPFISAYPWSGSGFGTKVANPATAVSAIPFCVAFSPNGDAVFIGITKGFTASPYVEVYAWSVSGFGTKLSGPSDISVGSVQGIDFDATGQYVGFADQNTGRISVFPWTIGGGFGSQVSAPATPPTGNGTGIAFTINS